MSTIKIISIVNRSQHGRSFMTSLGKMSPGKTLDFPEDSKELEALLSMSDIVDSAKIIPQVHDKMEALKSENENLRKRVKELESQVPASVVKEDKEAEQELSEEAEDIDEEEVEDEEAEEAEDAEDEVKKVKKIKKARKKYTKRGK